MFASNQRRDDLLVQSHRRDAGRWLRELREASGLSQRELAALVGVDHHTFISQLEAGRGRIPPERYEVWALALQMEPRILVQGLMRYYDPIAYRILFDNVASA